MTTNHAADERIAALEANVADLTAIVERQGEQLSKYVGPFLAGFLGFESNSVVAGGGGDDEPDDARYIADKGGLYNHGQRIWYRFYSRLGWPHIGEGSLDGDIAAQRERNAIADELDAMIDAGLDETDARMSAR